jgi:photosystem II stability/assembly factor-like uncharacterized protein
MSIIYIATGDSFVRLSSRGDNLLEWDVHTSLEGSAVQCLAVDPRDARTVYCGSITEGIWKSSDGGGRWSNVTPEMGAAGIFSLAVSAADGAIYAGCEPSMLWVSQDGGRNWDELENLRLIPSAPTWSFPPRPWTSHVRAIAPNPHHADWLLAGIELGGVMFSNDGGWSWDDHRPAAHRDVHALTWHPAAPARAYEAAGGGCAWSEDGGWSWHTADEGRDWSYCYAQAVDPADPDCWFVAAAPGPQEAHGSASQGALYRRRGGAPWQKLGGGLPDPLPAMPYALALEGSTLVAGLRNGDLWFSTDRGDTWQAAILPRGNLAGIRALALVETRENSASTAVEKIA